MNEVACLAKCTLHSFPLDEKETPDVANGKMGQKSFETGASLRE